MEVLHKEGEDLYVLNVLPVWLALEFGFTELRGAVEVVVLWVCWCVENLNADDEVWVYKGCGFSMNTPAGWNVQLQRFNLDLWGQLVSVFPSLPHSNLSTWDRRCLDRWGCSSKPAESGGLCPGGKEGGREKPASGDNSTRQIRAEPGGRHLGRQEDNDKQWQRGGSDGVDRAAEGQIRHKDQLQSLLKRGWINTSW